MSIIFKFLKKYRFLALLTIGFTMTELMIELIQPLIIANIIDDGIAHSNLETVTYWGVVLLTITVASFGIGIVSSFFSSHVSQSFGFDLREKLYEKVQALSLASFNRFSEASLITRLTNDIVQVQNTVFMGLRIMLRAPLFVIGSAIMAFVVSPKLAIWFTAALPFLFVFLLWILKRGQELFRKVQKQLDKVNGVMQQNLTSMRLVRVFVRKQHETKRFVNEADILREQTASAMRLTELTMPIILVVMNAAVIVVLWFGKQQLQWQGVTVGEIIAIVNYATRTTGALSIMSMIIINFSRAKASAERIKEVFDAEEEYSEPAVQRSVERSDDVSEQASICFDDVSFRYSAQDETVLSNISFQVNTGERIAIMGATGSGKSSLVQLIPRMYEVSSGTISIGGKNINSLSLPELRTQIGYVPQEVILFSGTIVDNLKWGNEHATMEQVIEAAKAAQIHDTIMQLPEQYETLVGQKGVNLSGGQKQRLTIARALIRKPLILLLDDCTSALDVKTEAALLQALQWLRCTTFLVTQKISSTTDADKVLILDDGQLLAEGKHEQLLQQSALYKAIYESQQRKAGVSNA
ncbi:ABC transporter ATP-binding protein [Paenibacillus yanchengensis]|uniref:ABC transporter ATP-binding protein n=1 Tax=Paenibacillus yanchengensis TaxID=2035833 RepID=A0ABW4YPX9_9BACL